MFIPHMADALIKSLQSLVLFPCASERLFLCVHCMRQAVCLWLIESINSCFKTCPFPCEWWLQFSHWALVCFRARVPHNVKNRDYVCVENAELRTDPETPGRVNVRMSSSNKQKSAKMSVRLNVLGCGSFFQAKAFPEWGDGQRRLCKVISLLCSQCEFD